ncbi:MAG: BamA/TamA family outer membrane protein, partial [Verrucomicrobiota bacterium]
LSLVTFADAGNLLQDSDDASLDDLRYAVGAGLRYLTPIGPIRLEYGYNPDQKPGEPDGTMHLGFGFSY